MSLVVTHNADGSETTTVLDDASGLVDVTWTTVGNSAGGQSIFSKTDYDLTDVRDWASHSALWSPGLLTSSLARIKVVMDDGSSHQRQIFSFPILGGHTAISREVTTSWAANGNLDYVHEVTRNFNQYANPQPDYRWKGLDYDPLTGNLDYSIIEYNDGRVEAIDYDPLTGHRDYAVITYRDGSVTARDYDAATGRPAYAITTYPQGRVLAEDYDAAGVLDYSVTTYAPGHVLALDYDSAGRVDYAIETFADGRRSVTDHDIADGHPWATFTIHYGAGGDIIGTAFT